MTCFKTGQPNLKRYMQLNGFKACTPYLAKDIDTLERVQHRAIKLYSQEFIYHTFRPLNFQVAKTMRLKEDFPFQYPHATTT